jgi:CHAT domain-containing protein
VIPRTPAGRFGSAPTSGRKRDLAAPGGGDRPMKRRRAKSRDPADLVNRASALIDEHLKSEDPVRLAEAYDLLRTADAGTRAGWPGRPVLDYNLGLVLFILARSSNEESLCRQAVSRLRSALDSSVFNKTGAVRSIVTAKFADACILQFQLSRDLSHAPDALAAVREALSTAAGTSDELRLLTQLGNVFLLRHEMTHDDVDLAHGLDAALAARAAGPETFRSMPGADRWLRYAIKWTLASGTADDRLPSLLEVAQTEYDAGLSETESRMGWLEVLAQCLFRRFLRTGDEADERRALDLTAELVQLAGGSGHDRNLARFLPAIARMESALRDDLYRIYLRRFPDTANLDADIDAHPRLKAALFADVRLGEDFVKRWTEAMYAAEAYKQSNDPSDVIRATSILNELIAEPGLRAASPQFRGVVLQTAAEAAFNLFWCTGDLDQLMLAVKLGRASYTDARTLREATQARAVRYDAMTAMLYRYGFPLIAGNLAVVLGEAYQRTDEAELLDEAFDRGREALEAEGQGTQEHWLHGVLGTILRYRYDRDADLHDLDGAIWHHRQAVTSHPRPHKRWAVTDEGWVSHEEPTDGLADKRNNLGTALRLRYLRSGAEEDLAEAAQHHEAALSLLPAEAPSHPSFLANLLDDLVLIHALHPEAARARLERVYDQATALGPGAPNQLLPLHRDLGRLAFNEQDWRRAADSFDRAARARAELQAAQAGFADKQYWLSAAGGLASDHAYALARLGELDAAVTANEHGLALLVAETLRQKEAYLDRLRTRSPELVAELLAARGELDAAERRLTAETAYYKGDTEVAASLARRRAWSRLRHADDAVTKALGRGLMSGVSPADIRRELIGDRHDHAVVYLNVTLHGSLALIVTADAVHAVWPPMSSTELRTLVTGYNRAGRNLIDYMVRDPGFHDALSAALDTLGTRLLAPVAYRLDELGVRHVTLVPSGQLNLLPLQAARVPGGLGETGYLLEFCTISHIPSTTLAIDTRQATGPGARRSSRYLGVAVSDDPDRPALPHARREVQTIAAQFTSAELLLGPDADPRQVLALLPQVDVAHFACHAAIDPANALDSALILADGARLTVRDLLTLPRSPRLVILSACSTAIPGDQLPDEALGLPTALLAAGTEGVLATAWPTGDLSARLVVEEFINEWLEDAHPAVALQTAQFTVRDMTMRHLADRLMTSDAPTRADTPRPDGRTPSLDRPFKSRLDWPAFTFTGATGH